MGAASKTADGPQDTIARAVLRQAPVAGKGQHQRGRHGNRRKASYSSTVITGLLRA